MTFGKVLADARKRAGRSQKDLATRILKEDGTPISPQYLNDLEHDRRNPPSEFLLKQIAEDLHVPAEYLFFIAGQFPEDLRGQTYAPDRVEAAFQAFRKTLKGA